MKPGMYKPKYLFFLLTFSLVATNTTAQSPRAEGSSTQTYKGLKTLKQEGIACYYSPGHDSRAEKIASFCADAINYFTDRLEFAPRVDLLVLSKTDWSNHTNFPVYGMPHYFDGKLVVASENNEFWESFIPAKGSLPEHLENKMLRAYTNEDGVVSMRPFFDMLVIHELGHAYYIQAGITAQRFWLSEFFSNVFLHSFVADKHPEMLPGLTTFPEVVIAAGSSDYKFTTLDQLEKNYELIGKEYPQNYGWYQCRWHKGAGEVYERAGKDLVQKFWNGVRRQKEKLSDEDLAEFLQEKVNPAMADFYRNWDK